MKVCKFIQQSEEKGEENKEDDDDEKKKTGSVKCYVYFAIVKQNAYLLDFATSADRDSFLGVIFFQKKQMSLSICMCMTQILNFATQKLNLLLN